MTEREYVLNGHQLVRALQLPAIVPASKRWDGGPWTIDRPALPGSGLRRVKGEAYKTFAEAQKALGVGELVLAKTFTAWFPVEAIEAAKRLEVKRRSDRSDKLFPVEFVGPGVPCEATVYGDFDSHLCGRLAVGKIRAPFGGPDAPPVPGCKMHVGHEERRAEESRRRREQWDAQRAAQERREETAKANAEAAERIRPALEALGIRPDSLESSAAGLRLPGEAMERIVAMAYHLDEVGLTDEVLDLREMEALGVEFDRG